MKRIAMFVCGAANGATFGKRTGAGPYGVPARSFIQPI